LRADRFDGRNAAARYEYCTAIASPSCSSGLAERCFSDNGTSAVATNNKEEESFLSANKEEEGLESLRRHLFVRGMVVDFDTTFLSEWNASIHSNYSACTCRSLVVRDEG